MSDTWNLVSHESKKRVWIGQGNGHMSTFYSGEPDTMKALHQFLVNTRGEPLYLVSDMRGGHHDYEDFSEPKNTLVGYNPKTAGTQYKRGGEVIDITDGELSVVNVDSADLRLLLCDEKSIFTHECYTDDEKWAALVAASKLNKDT